MTTTSIVSHHRENCFRENLENLEIFSIFLILLILSISSITHSDIFSPSSMLPSKSRIMYEHNMEPECKTNNTRESRLKKYIYIGVYEREQKFIVDMRKIGYEKRSKLFDSILSVGGIDISMLFFQG